MRIKSLLLDDFYRDSALIFVSSSLVNLFNLLFWLYMVRVLSSVDYGILNSLMGLLIIVSLPAGIIQTTLTRYIAEYQSKGYSSKIRALIIAFFKRLFYLAVIILSLFFLFQEKMSSYLRLSDPRPLGLIGIIVFVSFISPLTMSGLQGLQFFGRLALNVITSGLVKLVLGIILVTFGFRVLGALGGFLISAVFAFILSIFQLPKSIWQKTSSFAKALGDSPPKSWRRRTNPIATIDLKEIYRYFFPVGLASLSFVILTNIDIILVKHYFSPLDAGFYSVAGIIGKIILFLPGAVSVVLFPKVSGLGSLNKSSLNLLKKSLYLVGSLIFIGVLICLFFPKFLLTLLTSKNEPVLFPLARLFAISFGFFSLANILLNFHLALKKFRFIFFTIFFCILQIILISLFHQTLNNVLYILILISFILFLLGLKEAFYA